MSSPMSGCSNANNTCIERTLDRDFLTRVFDDGATSRKARNTSASASVTTSNDNVRKIGGGATDQKRGRSDKLVEDQLSSMPALERGWVCPVRSSRVFQHNRTKNTLRVLYRSWFLILLHVCCRAFFTHPGGEGSSADQVIQGDETAGSDAYRA